jgi:hypothetical protein
MEWWRFVIGIPMFFVVIIVLGYVFGYFFGGLAKLTNRNFVRHGRTIYTPDTIDYLNQDLLNKKDKLFDLYSKIANRSKTNHKNILEDEMASKLDKLNNLSELLSKNIINQSEFEILKNEIMNS